MKNIAWPLEKWIIRSAFQEVFCRISRLKNKKVFVLFTL
ncbi:hypothetical protein EfmE980_2084 [Enterococcus faecium E980]|nr:hypothetical protein EfmE980_2084 [Enterococcus faecium E980]MBL4989734.1 hypothetical protein [Enterococcus lactis]MBL4992417.1 hypothetical protein [Enterococcus lactis]MBL4998827.1 hypothetical protein [Enterococcus lactis]MBL5002953.1 hypothetical protein [Enterococcus lactis]